MSRAVKAAAALLAALLLACPGARAAEGGAMLPLSALQALQGEYEAFLSALEEELVGRGLLSEGDREAWHAAQLGDYLSNGGYGSILITYLPDSLGYVREEETALELSCMLGARRLRLSTMRRYAPGDSASEGLMLSFSLEDEGGMPCVFSCALSSETGIFCLWDALAGGYQPVSQSVETPGEPVLWSAGVPAENAADAVILAVFTDPQTGEELGRASLRLGADGGGYRLEDGALQPA